jgi:hypothetical protein
MATDATQDRLPSMHPEDMPDAAADFLEANIGWHRTIGVAIGISEATGEWPELRQLGRVLVELGHDRIVNRGNLVRHEGREDRPRHVWSYNHYQDDAA